MSRSNVLKNRQKLMMAIQNTGTLAGSPNRPNRARRANGLGEDQNSGAEMPSGKNSTSLFCILSNQHIDQRFSQLLLVLYFFFSLSPLEAEVL